MRLTGACLIGGPGMSKVRRQKGRASKLGELLVRHNREHTANPRWLASVVVLSYLN